MIVLSKDDAKQLIYYETIIAYDLQIQTMAIRGHDKQNRPILIRQSRQSPWIYNNNNSNNNDDENDVDKDDTSKGYMNDTSITAIDMDQSYEWAQLYMSERAIAIGEILNHGRNDKLSVFFDYTVYNSRNAPPMNVLIRTITTLQTHYPERLGKAVIIDAPFWMTTIIQMVSPFLAKKTRDKIVAIRRAATSASSWLPTSGNTLWRSLMTTKFPATEQNDHNNNDGTHDDNDEQHSLSNDETSIRNIVDADQAMTFMRSDGQLVSNIDITYQIQNVPFYELYIYNSQSVTTADETDSCR
jgi:hypothetical protein